MNERSPVPDRVSRRSIAIGVALILNLGLLLLLIHLNTATTPPQSEVLADAFQLRKWEETQMPKPVLNLPPELTDNSEPSSSEDEPSAEPTSPNVSQLAVELQEVVVPLPPPATLLVTGPPTRPREKLEIAEPKPTIDADANHATESRLPPQTLSEDDVDQRPVPKPGNAKAKWPPHVKGLEDVVVVVFLVDELGAVQIESCQGKGHSAFSQAARRAVEKWRFWPAQHGGKPVTVRCRQPIEFRLRQ